MFQGAWLLVPDLFLLRLVRLEMKDRGCLSPLPPVAVVQSLSHGWLFANSWTLALQASLIMGFPRQEFWSELPFPSPGYLPNTGIEFVSPTLAGRFFTTEPPGKPNCVPEAPSNFKKNLTCPHHSCLWCFFLC